MNDEEIKLKPCPFCGEELSKYPDIMVVHPVHSEEYLIAMMNQKDSIIGTDKYFAVHCNRCGAVGRREPTKEKAKQMWNARGREEHEKVEPIFSWVR